MERKIELLSVERSEHKKEKESFFPLLIIEYSKDPTQHLALGAHDDSAM